MHISDFNKVSVCKMNLIHSLADLTYLLPTTGNKHAFVGINAYVLMFKVYKFGLSPLKKKEKKKRQREVTNGRN